jgi:RNA polymerase sigma-70 factor (ECF subfamily)
MAIPFHCFRRTGIDGRGYAANGGRLRHFSRNPRTIHCWTRAACRYDFTLSFGMSSQESPSVGLLPTTRWSLVQRAGQELPTAPRPAMDQLLRRYLPALRVRLLARRTIAPEAVDDVLQGFISQKFLEHNLLGGADRTKGKFRTLLLTALDRYVISHRREASAAKRGAGRTVSLDEPGDGDAPLIEPTASIAANADPFDVQWAREIVQEAISRVRAACESGNRPEVWGVFHANLVRPILHGDAPLGYGELVERFAFRSPGQVWHATRTGKQMFARHLRAVVREYAQGDAEVEEELRDLRRILAAAGAD